MPLGDRTGLIASITGAATRDHVDAGAVERRSERADVAPRSPLRRDRGELERDAGRERVGRPDARRRAA